MQRDLQQKKRRWKHCKLAGAVGLAGRILKYRRARAAPHIWFLLARCSRFTKNSVRRRRTCQSHTRANTPSHR